MPYVSTQDHATVKWNTEIGHKLVGSLSARMDVKFRKKELGAPKCSLEVWAMGKDDESSVELAYCHANFCPTKKITRIKWLGRSECRPVHSSVRGMRSVLRAGAPVPKLCLPLAALPGALDEEPEPRPGGRAPRPKLTVAEALLSVTMSILANFGASTVQLQAMDNGSGKLVQFYANLGLRELPQIPGELLRMEGPVRPVVDALPTYWTDDLVPADFDGPTWLREVSDLDKFSGQLVDCRWIDDCTEHGKHKPQDDQSDPAPLRDSARGQSKRVVDCVSPPPEPPKLQAHSSPRPPSSSGNLRRSATRYFRWRPG